MRVTQVKSDGSVSSIRIRDGKWVLETSVFVENDLLHEVVGTLTMLGSTNVEIITTEISGDERLLTLVSDEPFGVIEETIEDGVVTARWFVCARKLEKGKRKYPPKTARPKTVLPIEEAGKRYGQKLVKLSEVAEIVGMTRSDLLLRFFPFTDRDEPKIKLYVDDAIVGPTSPGEWIELEPAHLEQFIQCRGDTIWIRDKFAMAVIQMVHFGYRPPLINMKPT